jgi:putative ABC transport system permease protein
MDAGVIVSQSALRRLGFASPQAAIGKNFMPAEVPAAERRRLENNYPPAHSLITAVVPDFTFASLGQANFTERLGTIYTPWVRTIDGTLVHIKLDGQRIPETLAAIDRLWETTNQVGRINRFFLDDHIEQLYRNLSRQALFLAACAGITILLACLGLVGIAIATAERRTKEIGVRKALGATTPRIVWLLLWQFSLPVLLGSLIAWPIAFWLMRRWLAGFAWHIELQWWMFAAASGLALVLALLTVAGQAIQTARAKPVLALRYE